MWSLDVLIFDGVEPNGVLDLLAYTKTANTIATSRSARPTPHWDVRLLSAGSTRAIDTESGTAVAADASFHSTATGDVVWFPSGDVSSIVGNRAIEERLSEARSRALIVVGVGAGSTILASAGLLRGRVALDKTVAAELSGLEGELGLTVETEATYVDQGDLMTATVQGARNLALHLIARKGGAQFARQVARERGVDWDQGAGIDLPPVTGDGLF